MAINFAGIPSLEPKENIVPDYVGAFGKGLDLYTKTLGAGYARRNLENESVAKELANKINEAKAKYAAQQELARLQNTQASTGHLGAITRGQEIENQYKPQTLAEALKAAQFKAANPLLSSTGAAGQIGAMLYLQQHPEIFGQNAQGQEAGESTTPGPVGNEQRTLQNMSPSELLKQSILASLQPKSKQYAPTNVLKNLDYLHEAESGFIPGTNRSQKFDNEDQQRSYVDALREATTGVKKGEHYVYDPQTKEKIGIESRTTPKEAATIEGRAIFNGVMPYIRAADEFSGKDSIAKFDRYASEYGVNPEATQKIDDLIVAQKLLSAGTVNEAATLGAGKQLAVYNNLKNSLSAIDVPERLQKLELGLKIPNRAFIKASKTAQEIINNVTDEAAKTVPATKVHYYHPEKYLKSEEEKKAALESHAKTITVRNKKTGITETISLAEARKRGIPNV